MPKGFPLVLAPIIFIGYILLEIAAFIFIGGKIGVLPSLTIVVLSSLGGIWWLKANFRSFSQSIEANFHNSQEMNLLLSRRLIGTFGAVLLIIPGFVSSVCGLILVIPFVQDALASLLIKHNYFKSSFSFNNFDQRQKDNASNTSSTIDLDPKDYHSENPEDSPWKNLK